MPLTISFRLCTHEDLPALQWEGLFRSDRRMFAETFRKQERGEQLMLVADVNGSLVAQAWFDLERATNRNAVYLWAMRVIPWLHGFGIGSRLLHYAGNVASECGFTAVELTVDKGNARARKLYERFGFQMIDEIEELEPYTNARGKRFSFDAHDI